MDAAVIDTSVWIEAFARGAPGLVARLRDDRVRLPPLVAAEILSGRFTALERARIELWLSELRWCTAGKEHWLRVGRLRSVLRSRGVTLTTPDAHVAQCTLDLGAELWTDDRVFRQVARHVPLRLGDWRLDA